MEGQAKFIRGYLDSSETKLIKKANEFAEELRSVKKRRSHLQIIQAISSQ
ncbi:hypothetical protein [Desnuesiella massiliensis]|nr:hypothetical protein [Desnuesiella massiliensis]